MRYPASKKLEIIRTVEGSHLPVKQTLDMLGIPRTTFIDGMISMSTAAWMGWLIGPHAWDRSGTASLMLVAMI